MNANAKAWVEALRSGEYVQGRGRLHTIESAPEGLFEGADDA